MFFKQIQGEAAVLITGGVYNQVDMYERDKYLFAKHGGGFIRLTRGGGTSKAKVAWDAISLPNYSFDSLGRLKYA